MNKKLEKKNIEKKVIKPKKEKKSVEKKKVIEPEKKEETIRIYYSKNVLELTPVVTEKAVMAIETQNVLTFKTPREKNKLEIKKEVEDLFDVKVEKIKTHIKNNKKYAHVKINRKFPAIDIATKLGII